MPHFGQRTKTLPGAAQPVATIVPEIAIGQIRMTNVSASTGRFSDEFPLDHLRALGLLGYDFIAGAVIHVNYEKETVEAIRADAFDAQTLPDATQMPISLDYGVPVSPVRIGRTLSDQFMLDTGTPDLMIFSKFAHAHRDDVKDQGKGDAIRWLFRYAYILSVYGAFQVQPTQVAGVTFGPTRFGEVMAMEPQDAGRFEAAFAGLVGYELLRFYDVYFDYARGRVVVAPGSTLQHHGRHA